MAKSSKRKPRSYSGPDYSNMGPRERMDAIHERERKLQKSYSARKFKSAHGLASVGKAAVKKTGRTIKKVLKGK